MGWEWRAFAAGFPGVPHPDGGETVVRTDLYLLAERLDPGASLKLRGATRLEYKARLGRQGEVEEWSKELCEELVVPPWVTRELARWLVPGGRVPVRPLRSEPDLLRFLADLGLGAPRSVAVAKRLRKGVRPELPGVRLELAEVELPGFRGQSLALEAEDPATIEEARAALAAAGALPADLVVGAYPSFLRGRGG